MNENGTPNARTTAIRTDLDVPMPGGGMGLDRDIDRDFTPEEARRALSGEDDFDGGGTADRGTDETDLDTDSDDKASSD
jgi:hypothetical protein